MITKAHKTPNVCLPFNSVNVVYIEILSSLIDNHFQIMKLMSTKWGLVLLYYFWFYSARVARKHKGEGACARQSAAVSPNLVEGMPPIRHLIEQHWCQHPSRPVSFSISAVLLFRNSYASSSPMTAIKSGERYTLPNEISWLKFEIRYSSNQSCDTIFHASVKFDNPARPGKAKLPLVGLETKREENSQLYIEQYHTPYWAQ